MEALSRPGIYRLVFPDGSYVGQSANVKSRLKQHLTKMTEGIHTNYKIRAAVAEYGLPTMEVLEYCSLGALNAAEIHWMDKYDCFPNGYNLKEGGDYPREVASSECLMVLSTPKEQEEAMLMLVIPILIGFPFGFIHVGLGFLVWFVSFFIYYLCH